MIKRIALITPLVDTGAFTVGSLLSRSARPDVVIENHFLAEGPLSVETKEDVAAAIPGVVAVGKTLAADGADAIIVNCMCDPGVAELRAEVDCPVLGPAEIAMHFVAGLGQRFGLLDVLDESREEMEDLVDRFGVRDAFCSYRAIGVAVLDIEAQRSHVLEALVRSAAVAVRDDGAQALILACTGFSEFAREIRVRLAAMDLHPLVVEPGGLAIDMARLALGSAHG